jgi:predicted  nucleic acid-binding Zn-ribbon protein
LALYDELHQMLKTKASLEERLGQSLSVPEEIERLTQKVKVANSEIQNMEREISQTLDHINKLREQIATLERQMSESRSNSEAEHSLLC